MSGSCPARRLRPFALAWLLFPAAACLAQNTPPEPLRVVLKGYDPVAYFSEARPVKGVAEIMYDWTGARYQFANTANRDTFIANPERYAPQFGGYCANSVSKGKRHEADPEAWLISNGKLYVFGKVETKEMAEKDPRWLAERIAEASENWRKKD